MPLLFLLFIDPITNKLPEYCALFMDDLWVWVLDHDRNKAAHDIQTAIDNVAIWSRENKITLNPTRCEITFFSLASIDSNWKPNTKLHGRDMPFEPNPKLVGVRLDRTLSFAHHTDDVTKKVEGRTKMLRAVANKSWGWKKITIRRVYQANQRTALDYAAGDWQPWLSKTQRERPEKAGNKALRAITGHATSTTIEALRIEAGIHSYESHSNRLKATSKQKQSANTSFTPDVKHYQAQSTIASRKTTGESGQRKYKQPMSQP